MVVLEGEGGGGGGGGGGGAPAYGHAAAPGGRGYCRSGAHGPTPVPSL